MVQSEQPSIATRLSARIDAHDEKLATLTTEMQTLSSAVLSIQNTLATFPDRMEKMITDLFKLQGKSTHTSSSLVFNEDGSVHVEPIASPLHPSAPQTSVLVETSGSGLQPHGVGTHPQLPDNPPEDSLFSLPKVKLPLFDGHDPRGRITKAELYFQVHNTPIPVKLQLVQMCMDGVALNWYTNLLYRHPQTSWTQLRSKLMLRFSGTRFLNAYEALGSLYQDGNVDEYIEQFEAVSALIPDQTEEQSVGLFLRGLHDEIRNWVRILNPTSCDEAMDAARRIEIATRAVDDVVTSEGGYDRSLSRYPQTQSRQR